MDAPLFFLSVDIALIVCNALFGARVLARYPRLASAQLIALIAFDTICHVALSRYEYRYWIPAPYRFQLGGLATSLNFARNLTPGLFMILCFTMFVDRGRFPRWLVALFIAEMFLEVPMQWLVGSSATAAIATRILPGLLQAMFVGFALYWTIASWRADLIESRRRARVLTIVLVGLNIIGSSLLLRILIPQDEVANYNAHLALTLSNLPIVLLILVFLRDEDLRGPLHAESRPATSVAATSPPVSPEVAAVLARLGLLMEGERVYRRPSLSLKQLADLVQTPEYRLRKIIHEQLGYANYNVFLHSYRIREACQQLRDPALRRIPILTIALSTGYQSINTFNRGFRDIMGLTPSAYRGLDEARVPPMPGKISPESA